MKKLSKILAVLLTICMILSIIPTAFAGEKETVDFAFLVTSDLHGQVFATDYTVAADQAGTYKRGLTRISTYINEMRAEYGENLYVADMGDTIQGAPMTYYYAFNKLEEEQPAMKAFRTIGYDLWVVGNHEFNYGLKILNKQLEDLAAPATETEKPVDVCMANYLKAETNTDEKKDWATWKDYAPYYIKDFDGVKVAVIGFGNPNIPKWDIPSNWEGIYFADIIETYKHYEAEMLEKADMIVVVAHSGIGSDEGADFMERLVAQTNTIDFAFSGHEHGNQVFMAKNSDGKEIPVLQPYTKARAISQVKVSYNKAEKTYELTPENVNMEGYALDEDLVKVLQPYEDATWNDYMLQPIGKALGDYPAADLGTAPSAFMDLINTVQLWGAYDRTGENTPDNKTDDTIAQLSISAPLTAGDNANLISTGDIHLGDMFGLYRFENWFYQIKMSGEEVHQWLEFAATKIKLDEEGKPTVSSDDLTYYDIIYGDGFTYDIDYTAPIGARVKNITYKEAAVKADDEFTVVVNNYRYNGGGNYVAWLNEHGCKFIANDPDRVIYSTQFDMLQGEDEGQARTLLTRYIEDQTKTNGGIEPKIDSTWKLIDGTGDEDRNPFEDVKETDWFYDIVMEMVKAGVVNGKTPTTFEPNSNVTRAEFVTMLYRYDGENKVDAPFVFTDVEKDFWYTDPIAWAAANGIVNGMTPTTFEPDTQITREQIVTILYRYAKYANLDTTASDDLSAFADADKVSDWALDAMKWAVANGIVNGDEKSRINPQDYATRAEAVAMIARLANVAPVEDLTILYTNDVHTYIDQTISYANISAYKKSLAETGNVLLVDAGDHIQGTAYGGMDKGATIIKLMNAAGYDLATLGNHEFDYGMERALKLKDEANYPYVSCNFYNEKDGVKGDSVLDAYKVFTVGGRKIAIIGITTPETFTKSTPKYFQDDAGNYIYGIAGGADGKELYEAVQKAIDDASKEADVVIALGHLGDDPASDPWNSEDVIANTSGLDAFIDGHSHSSVPMKEVEDKDGAKVVLTQTGNYFAAIGQLTIAADGTISAELVTEAEGVDEDVKAIQDAWVAEVDSQLGTKIAESEINFVITYENGNRAIRSSETNLGDLNADAYYWFTANAGLEPDMAIMNGGGIRAKVDAGDWTYKTCKTVNTFGNVLCVVEITGQQILDALEFGARFTTGDPENLQENGGFLQVAGCTYEIDTSVANTVKVDDKSVWIGAPDAYRVTNVKIYNKETKAYEPLDLEKTYRVAGTNYTLYDCGDGFDMFKGGKHVLDGISEDYLAMAGYLQAFTDGKIATANSPLAAYENYLINYEASTGAGRIVIK